MVKSARGILKQIEIVNYKDCLHVLFDRTCRLDHSRTRWSTKWTNVRAREWSTRAPKITYLINGASDYRRYLAVPPIPADNRNSTVVITSNIVSILVRVWDCAQGNALILATPMQLIFY